MALLNDCERTKTKTNCRACSEAAAVRARTIRRRPAGNGTGQAHAFAARTAGLCQELVYGVVRWQTTLDWLIARKTEGRTQKDDAAQPAATGLYQIFWLDRIPDHAAVHETVELAKQRGFGPQAGFVNAVLRGYMRERVETEKLLADLKTSSRTLGYSHPEWLDRTMAEPMGRGESGATDGMEQHPAADLCAGQPA